MDPSGGERWLRRPRYAWMESLVITALVPAFGMWLRPDEPFFLTGAFPWCVLAPLLAGLRYGFVHGLLSSVAIIVGAAALMQRGWPAYAEFPSHASLGLVGVGLLAGEFSDMWERRGRKLAAVDEFRRRRMEEFARSYHALKVSHDRLEHRHAGGTVSLREALLSLGSKLGNIAADTPYASRDARERLLDACAESVMDVFTGYGWVQSAALYPVDRQGALVPTPLRTLGEAPSVNPDHPLIREALAAKLLTAVRPGSKATSAQDVPLVAAIPFVDVSGSTWALLAVHSMSFIAFHEDNLRLLALLGGHAADAMLSATAVDSTVERAPLAFRRRLERCIEDARRYDLPSSVLAISVPESDDALVDRLVGQRRGLDRIWVAEDTDGGRTVWVVLPFTDRRGLDGYVARLEGSTGTGNGRKKRPLSIVSRVLTKSDQSEEVLAALRGSAEGAQRPQAHEADTAGSSRV